MRHAIVAAAIAAITLLGVFVFPGHTWLQSDTQIYAPMLEQLSDPSLYQRELITSRPHLAWTIYDESARLVRWTTGLDFQYVLLLEQILFRALAIWGVYLIGRRFAESPVAAMLVAAIVSLGATIVGPAVLTFEYEPVPRGFAVSLLLCAIGLAVHGDTFWASVAASIAMLYHAPTTIPFWIVLGIVILRSRQFTALIPPVTAAGLLLLLEQMQPGAAGHQQFFGHIPPDIEQLQRLRAPYNWVSQWMASTFWHYAILCGAIAVALYRLGPKLDTTARLFFAGLPALGWFSIPLSYVLLEHFKLSLMPQLQPARAVLLITLSAVILCSAAAVDAAASRRFIEAFLWFLPPFLIPIQHTLFEPFSAQRAILILALAAIATATLALPRGQWAGVAATFAAAVFLAPAFGKVINYAQVHSSALDEVSAWARHSTPKNAVFVFPAPGKNLRPGIFRVKSLRAVYVDWKAGGQVNYFDDLGREWWRRWQQVELHNEIPPDAGYVVYQVDKAPAGVSPVYRNEAFEVVATR